MNTRRFFSVLLSTGTVAACSLLAALPKPLTAQDAEANSALESLQKTLRPEHVDFALNWEGQAKKLLDQLAIDNPDLDAESNKETQKNLTEFRKLINAPRQVIPKLDELVGNWQVRSLQAGPLGAYVYPFFKCHIKAQGKSQVLLFDKPTGSQRRSGQLARIDGKHLLFVGASYYGYEGSPRKYSTLLPSPTDEDRERDSIGQLYKISKDRYFIVFPEDAENFELYELKK